MFKTLFYFFEASLFIGLLFIAYILVKFIPFRWLAPTLSQNKNFSVLSAKNAERYVNRLRYRLPKVAQKTPWLSTCLMQAIVAKWLLRLVGAPNTLCIGIRHDEKNALNAHAWTISKEKIITGWPIHTQYQLLTEFKDSFYSSHKDGVA